MSGGGLPTPPPLFFCRVCGGGGSWALLALDSVCLRCGESLPPFGDYPQCFAAPGAAPVDLSWSLTQDDSTPAMALPTRTPIETPVSTPPPETRGEVRAQPATLWRRGLAYA